jgi:putative aldouronate transport system permease protein
MRHPAAASGSSRGHRAGAPQTLARLVRQRYLFAMLLPGIALIMLFSYVPLNGWIMAFTRYRPGFPIWSGEWVGLKQFGFFFVGGRNAFTVVKNTLVLNLSSMLCAIGAGLLLAILINEVSNRFYKRLVQTVSFFPFFVSATVTYLIFWITFSSSSGVLNNFLVRSGILSKGINLLGEEKLSVLLICMVNTWKNGGYFSVLFLAAISNIDHEQYESADIDGAGRVAKAFYITLPGIVPTVVVLIIINIGWIFSSNFEMFYLFTNPTNLRTMEVIDIYLYRYGLQKFDFSYATAVGIIRTGVSILLVFLTDALSRKIRNVGLF